MFVRQLFDRDTWTYTYLVADPASKEAAIIDPVKEQFDRDAQLIEELGFKLKYVLETHVHADHITSSGKLRDRFGAKVVLQEASNANCADILAKDGDVLTLGAKEIKVMHTPGHTDADATFQIEGAVFTGDALFVRGCGRTDFQAGSTESLYSSIHDKIFSLPDETLIYPGHDYKGHTVSTVGEEKAYNPRLGAGKNLEAFAEIMDNLNLPAPARLKESLPGNMRCGADLN
ncbi:MAG: Zn-dependent hydrolase [Acidithiobacillales bacterium SG8_45]|jgi:sulfur dioxygenase|nr:MAG: Zn-dependent hydrolase [Acidithiobacillales bacterium SG8_45]